MTYFSLIQLRVLFIWFSWVCFTLDFLNLGLYDLVQFVFEFFTWFDSIRIKIEDIQQTYTFCDDAKMKIRVHDFFLGTMCMFLFNKWSAIILSREQLKHKNNRGIDYLKNKDECLMLSN